MTDRLRRLDRPIDDPPPLPPPPPSCGHEGSSLTEFQRLWAEDRAEIARLRRIEEAARKVDEVDSRYARSFVPPQLSERIASLRATLEEGKPPPDAPLWVEQGLSAGDSDE